MIQIAGGIILAILVIAFLPFIAGLALIGIVIAAPVIAFVLWGWAFAGVVVGVAVVWMLISAASSSQTVSTQDRRTTELAPPKIALPISMVMSRFAAAMRPAFTESAKVRRELRLVALSDEAVQYRKNVREKAEAAHEAATARALVAAQDRLKRAVAKVARKFRDFQHLRFSYEPKGSKVSLSELGWEVKATATTDGVGKIVFDVRESSGSRTFGDPYDAAEYIRERIRAALISHRLAPR